MDCPSLSDIPCLPITYSLWFNLDSYPKDEDLSPLGGGVMTLIGRESAGSFDQGALVLYNERSAIEKYGAPTLDLRQCARVNTRHLRRWIHSILRVLFNWFGRELFFDEVKMHFREKELLEAVLITQSGNRTEQPLGIATRWDILPED